MPELSSGDVQRFVELGQTGRELMRKGDAPGAASAFLGQIAITPVNAEPYVSLALLEAARGEQQAALYYLRSAVLRGFTDLTAIERAEAWSSMRRGSGFLDLQDAIPALLEAERKWGDWSTFRARSAPPDLASALGEQTRLRERIDAMAPALGARNVRLWHRTIDRATAAALATYVEQRADAPDLEQALERLMAIYAGSPLLRWELLPPEAAGRLRKVADVALERFPESSLRSGALVCGALARFPERDRKGVLTPPALESIRASLDEVLSHDAESPFLALAAEGSVRAEAAAGRMDLAAARYRGFRESHASDHEVLARVRDELGEMALWAGGLPEFEGRTVDGATVDREALRGKIVVVDFWATWCAPCVEQLPTLRRISEKHAGEVLVLGVNLDRGEDLTVEALRAWVAREGVPGVQIHDGRSWESELVRLFGVKEIPFSVLAGADGTVLAVNAHGSALEKAVKSAIGRGSR